MADSFEADIAAISRIDAVPTILDVVCRTTGMGFAAVARVTEGRWIACNVRDDIAFGLQPGGELDVTTTICHEIRQTREPVVINHVAEDPTFCGHATPAMYGFQSYISMPIIRADGRFFGTLCAIDPKPARLDSPHVLGTFKLFADLIAFHLDALEKLDSNATELQRQRDDATLREQFIAVLGHDLRNPLASIAAGTTLLQRTPLTDKAAAIASLMQGSVARMSGLIDNVLDFARGRLGGGLILNLGAATALETTLDQVIAELRLSRPGRIIDKHFAFAEPVICDTARIAQLFSNLLGNALTHGAADQPIKVRAHSGDGIFALTVINGGAPIPAATLAHLFQAFYRGDVRPGRQGLGLGLYIASEIARAHEGTIEVISDAAVTCFSFQMPTEPTA